MAIAPGTHFGSYQVAALIGVGGMGEVYRATDTTLGRDVALKVLPDSLAVDADRIARFEREAKTLASLNHTNIGQIFGLERRDGTTALVMELVEGPTLAHRLMEGPIRVDEALNIAMQIAAALEAAHALGIVHRDLKPANIKLRPDGTVKVLDFGIAKALSARAISGPQGPALTTPAMTEAGMLLGTAAYMSPEQARGKPVDERADIWAFGCLLYELLTGQPAFASEDVTTTLARVLERSAEMGALPKMITPAVRHTIGLCLEKDPRKRIADIRDVRLALDGRFDVPIEVAATPEMVRRRVLPWASGALVTGAIVAGLAAWNLKPGGPPEPRQVVRSTFPLPANVGFRNTGRRVVAIAPDGRRFVYNAAGGLYVRSLDALDAQVIPGTEHSVFTPTFSPDGESIAFTQSGELRRIAVSGGSSLVLATLGEGAPDLSWEPDGTILYVQSDGIWQVSENGGDPQQLVAIEDGRAQGPQRLPGGDWVLYALVRTRPTSIAADDSEIVIASPSSGERRTLRARASHARYVPTGHMLYGYNGTLYAAPFDVGRLEFTAAPVPVVEGLRSAIQGGLFHFDISRTGTLVYVPGPAGAAGEEYGIGVADRAGTVTRLVVPPGAYRHVRASRDGKRLAFDSESGNDAIIWIYDLAGASAIRRLTFEGRNRFPVWSPDGERIAFQSDRGGSAAIFVERIDGAGGAQQVTTPNEGEVHIPEDWSPDGNHLSFSVLQERTFTLRFLSLEDGTATQLGSLQSVEPIGSVFSADGKWLAYHAVPRGTSAESASGGVFVEPFPATGARYQVPKVLRDFQPVWSADGPELFYVGSTASGQLAAVRISTESGLSFDGPTFLPFSLTADRLSANTRAFDVLPDGRFVGPATGMSEALVPQVRFVVNWFEELKRLVPTE